MHEQAFHTCCRQGLGSGVGFQFNARSAGLTDPDLDALAARMAGYHAPRDLPAEPSPDELAGFPVALAYREVPGVGRAVARTVYVGREFRGRDGDADSGRFGNYFSHIIVPDDAEPPLAIDLWEAPHWSDRESPTPDLDALATLTPGSLELERALELLRGTGRAAWIVPVLSAVGSALAGGPRVVLVEEPGEWAAAWVMLASRALPPTLAPLLTFSTYDGRPRSTDVLLCATTAGCDIAFPAHELEHQVALLNVAGGNPGGDAGSLFGRVAGALASSGAGALAEATRSVESLFGTVGPEQLGPALAMAAGDANGSGQPDVDDAAAWTELHRRARTSDSDAARSAAGIALAALAALADDLDPRAATLSGPAATPPAATLASWLELLAADDDALLAHRLALVAALRLSGVNSEMDHRIADAIFRQLRPGPLSDLLASWLDDGRMQPIAEGSLTALASAAARDEQVFARLAPIAEAVAFERIAALTDPEDFQVRLAVGRLRAAADPGQRAAIATELLTHAHGTEAGEQAATALYGALDRLDPAAVVELLRAYVATRSRPSRQIARRGWLELDATSLYKSRDPTVSALRSLLEQVDSRADTRPPAIAFDLADRAAAARRSDPDGWIDELVHAATVHRFSAIHSRELLGAAARLAVEANEPVTQRGRVTTLARAFGVNETGTAYTAALARAADERGGPQAVATAFEAWTTGRRPSRFDAGFADRLIADATSSWSARKRERVGEALSTEDLRETWERWCENNPARGSIGRMTRRLGRRKERGE